MKSYPSSELRNVCEELVNTEVAEDREDILQQMLERRLVWLIHPSFLLEPTFSRQLNYLNI